MKQIDCLQITKLTVFGLLAILSLFTVNKARAEVVRFEVTKRSPYAEGKSFGEIGPYEQIIGEVYYEIDPTLAQNAAIADLHHAPVNASGKVEFHSNLIILAPVHPDRGRRAVLYEVNNRGGRLAINYFNRGGNDFLFRYGYTVVWSGWDGELLPTETNLQLFAPVARTENGPITGPVRYEIVPDKDETRVNVNRGGARRLSSHAARS